TRSSTTRPSSSSIRRCRPLTRPSPTPGPAALRQARPRSGLGLFRWRRNERRVMELLFCCNPDMRKLPHPAFELEFDAAREPGFTCRLFGFEDFLEGRAERAFSQLPPAAGEVLLYRGWVFTEGEYRLLDAALHDRGYALFTSPEAYAEAL